MRLAGKVLDSGTPCDQGFHRSTKWEDTERQRAKLTFGRGKIGVLPQGLPKMIDFSLSAWSLKQIFLKYNFYFKGYLYLS